MISHHNRAYLAGCCAVVLQWAWAVFGEIEEVFQDELGDASLPVVGQERILSDALIDSMQQLYEDKIGLFIHWGPYAQLGGVWENKRGAEWIMRNAEIPVAVYESMAAAPFHPTHFQADEWVQLCSEAGMGFMVITAKHHDGFAMFDSKHPYNISDFSGFGRDPLAELHAACEKQGVRFGVYYSQSQDWYEEGGDGNSWQGWPPLNASRFEQYYREKVLMQVKELVTRFHGLHMIWFDTPGAFMSPEIIEETMDLVKKYQPQALINSRIGGGYGHFESAADQGLMPNVNTNHWRNGVKIPWQTHSTVAGLWGYASHLEEVHTNRYRSANRFIYELADIVSKGGVLLLNMAPNELGEVPIGQANVLRRVGDWLRKNGEAIYGADPSPLRNPDVPITSQPGKLFFHIKEQLAPDVEIKGIKTKVNRCYLLHAPFQNDLSFEQVADVIRFRLPKPLFEEAQGLLVVGVEYDGVLKIYDETLIPSDEEIIQLPVAKCEYNKLSISYDPYYRCTHKLARAWDRGGKSLSWTIRIREPGIYQVNSQQAFAPGLEGADYMIEVNGQKVKASPVVTEHGRNFITVVVGSVRFDQSGDYEIRLVMLDGARNTDFVERDTTGFDREFSMRSLELRLLQ